jgi:hypothetical protein
MAMGTAEIGGTMRDRPTGNWIALAGVIAYLLEFAVFIPAGAQLFVPEGSDVVAHFAARPTAFAIAAALLAVLLMGRVAFIAGLRSAIPAVATRPLIDLALGAMVVSVALEVGALGLAVGTARLASTGAEEAAVVGLYGAIAGLYVGVFPTFGLSVVAASASMISSRAFRLWLPVLGLVSGGIMMASGIADAVLYAGSQTQEETIGPMGWLGAVVWMLTTGVILMRRWRASRRHPFVSTTARQAR